MKGGNNTDNLEKIISIRIQKMQKMDFNLFCNTINKLEKYGVNFYNKQGSFVFDKFKKDCYKTHLLLYKNDNPNSKTGIKYQLCDFMEAIQTIVGIRNLAKFMSKD